MTCSMFALWFERKVANNHFANALFFSKQSRCYSFNLIVRWIWFDNCKTILITWWLSGYSFLFNTSHVVIRDTATLSALYFCHFFVYPHQFRHRTRTNQFKKPLKFGSKLVQYVLRKLPWLQLERKIRRDLIEEERVKEFGGKHWVLNKSPVTCI